MTNELIKISTDKDGQPAVSGRELHKALEVQTLYKDWFPRMVKYGFEEGRDFRPLKNEQPVKLGENEFFREITDHALSLDMAKEVAMIQRTDKGKEVRQYFIEAEKKLRANMPVLSDDEMALMVLRRLQAKVDEQKAQLAIVTPKAEYFDELVDRGCNLNFRDTAKEIGIKQSELIDELLRCGYVYRDQNNALKPYAQHCQSEKSTGYFTLKEYNARFNGHSGSQTLITPHGRQAFRMLFGKRESGDQNAEAESRHRIGENSKKTLTC
jgi:anti-repressor protein